MFEEMDELGKKIMPLSEFIEIITKVDKHRNDKLIKRLNKTKLEDF